MKRVKLTNNVIQKQCPPPPPNAVTAGGQPIRQKLYFDTEVRGFGVVVTRNDRTATPTRTFFVQRDVNGRTRRVKIGRFGDLTAEQARKQAQDIIPDMLKGIDPNAEKRRAKARGVTLGEAADDYRDKPTKRSRNVKATLTLRNHDRFLETLGDWKARPLMEITRAETLTRHKRLTTEIGPVGANNVMRWFRTVYNAAMIVHESLPPNPCIVLGDRWNKETRKRSPMSWERLAEWAAWVQGDLRTRNPNHAGANMEIPEIAPQPRYSTGDDVPGRTFGIGAVTWGPNIGFAIELQIGIALLGRPGSGRDYLRSALSGHPPKFWSGPATSDTGDHDGCEWRS